MLVNTFLRLNYLLFHCLVYLDILHFYQFLLLPHFLLQDMDLILQGIGSSFFFVNQHFLHEFLVFDFLLLIHFFSLFQTR